MSKEITVFNKEEFGEVRSITIDGEPWFVGKDIAKALEYKNPERELRKKVDERDKGVTKMVTPGGEQDIIIINESGFYSLVLLSKNAKAKEFKYWVTSEVLPSIRKTGAYHLSPAQQIAQMREERLRMKEENHLRKVTLEEKKVTLTHLNRMLKAVTDEEVKYSLMSEIAFVATGRHVLPSRNERTYSAKEIGNIIGGVSSNMVGRIANEHGLKTSQFGVWRTAIVDGVERQYFEYYNTVISEIKKNLDKGKGK